MNIFQFDLNTVKDLKEGDVFLFYEKDGGAWRTKLMIFQGFAPGHAVRLCFDSGDLSFNEAPDLETLSRRIAVKLLPEQHPTVVQSGLSYVFSA